MEAGKGAAEKKGTNEVVLLIPGSEKDSKPYSATEIGSYSFSKNSPIGSSPNGRNHSNIESGVQMSNFSSSPSPDVLKASPNTNKSPQIPAGSVIRRVSLARSVFSKPKSRLQEAAYHGKVKLVEEKARTPASSSPYRNSPNVASRISEGTATTPKDNLRSAPITPKTPLIGSAEGEEEDDEEVYKTANLKVTENFQEEVKVIFLVEWIALVCIMGLFIACLTVHRLQNFKIWSLELWKWCVLVSVILCGRLFTEWFINVLVFLIEKNFLLRKKVLYFVHGLKNSVQAFVWLGLILLAWILLFNHGVERSRKTTRILNYITRGLASSLIGAAIWLVKTLLIKIVGSSFQCSRFFDRIQEAIFHQYVVRTLSGPPLPEMAESIPSTKSSGRLSFKNLKKGKKEAKEGSKEEVIDVEKLSKMKQEKVSAWTMKGLMSVISGSGLSTLSSSLEDESVDDEEGGQKDEEINSEWEAKAAAYRIFINVAKHGSKYIDEGDLLRFMKKEYVDNVFPFIEGAAETGQIKRSSLKKWLVKVYMERKSLVHSLNDTKTAIEELNKVVSGFMLVVIIIVWLLLMGFVSTQVLVFISSQTLLLAFMFGNAAKTLFEAIIFVFVMHPFDIGDRCVIDGVQMVVEEVNILTTIFLKYDNEKIIYPNSILATKPISNFYRSPEMSDSVEFAVDFSTSIESIGSLKAKIKAYLESKPQHWRPGHSVLVNGIEDVNKMRMGLYVNHTINFQNYGDRSSRRSELVLELKKSFEELDIKYHLLPQEVHVSYVGPAASAVSPAR